MVVGSVEVQIHDPWRVYAEPMSVPLNPLILGLDHVQIEAPRSHEAAARACQSVCPFNA